MINEVQMELYVEDFLYRSGIRGFDPSYKDIDIYEEEGYDNYKEFEEHEAIQGVLKQFALIDPYKILITFGLTETETRKNIERPISSGSRSNGTQSTTDSFSNKSVGSKYKSHADKAIELDDLNI